MWRAWRVWKSSKPLSALYKLLTGHDVEEIITNLCFNPEELQKGRLVGFIWVEPCVRIPHPKGRIPFVIEGWATTKAQWELEELHAKILKENGIDDLDASIFKKAMLRPALKRALIEAGYPLPKEDQTEG